MNELPDSAKKLLAFERAAAGPSPETRARVRDGVALALATGVGAAVSGAHAATGSSVGAAKLGALAGATGKMWLAAGVIAVVSGVSVALHRTMPDPALPPSAASAKPSIEVRPPAKPGPSEPAHASADVASESEARSEPVAPRSAPAQRAAKSPRTSAHAVEATDLRAEMRLLAAASSALDRGELAAARAQLAQYRSAFAHGQLRREQRGLELLANCMANASGAATQARRYLSQDPSSMLAERIQTTCRLKPQP